MRPSTRRALYVDIVQMQSRILEETGFGPPIYMPAERLERSDHRGRWRRLHWDAWLRACSSRLGASRSEEGPFFALRDADGDGRVARAALKG